VLRGVGAVVVLGGRGLLVEIVHVVVEVVMMEMGEMIVREDLEVILVVIRVVALVILMK
jgi:hypothetical protein